MDVSVNVCGLQLANPIFNASGPRCTTKEELDALGTSAASVILSKSTTAVARDGNPEPRYHEFALGSINSMGLPNLGYKAYMEMYPLLRQHNKPIISSVSGLCKTDNLQMIKELSEVEALDAIELNLSCPNIPGKPQMAYDFEQSRDILEEVGKIIKKPWGVKLPPYFDFAHFQAMADVLNDSKINFVSCINSPGNGLVIDPETEKVVIKPKGGFGGIGGAIIKPFALSNVRKMRELLKPNIQVIGVGGITKGIDVFEHILAGADCVQVGTVLAKEGVGAFDRLNAELKAVMERKGYSSLSDFRNKLQTL